MPQLLTTEYLNLLEWEAQCQQACEEQRLQALEEQRQLDHVFEPEKPAYVGSSESVAPGVVNIAAGDPVEVQELDDEGANISCAPLDHDRAANHSHDWPEVIADWVEEIPPSQQDQIPARGAELLNEGFILIPLKRGKVQKDKDQKTKDKDGKAPIMQNWQKTWLSRTKFRTLMTDHASTTYGIRLDHMVVLDVDEKSPDLIVQLQARYGVASVIVETPRGFHLYYCGRPKNLPDLRQEGLSVDVLSGNQKYVVGPGSIRPSGGRYIEICGKLGNTPLNPFPETPPRSPANMDVAFSGQFRADGKVTVGKRNAHLWKRAIEFVQTCKSADELFVMLVHLRDEECEEPETLKDPELKGIAHWAFDKHVNGKLHAVTRGVYEVDRRFTELLSIDSNALALYVILKSNFGHIPGKTFQLCYQGMMAAKHINMSKNRFDAAKKLLRETGAIVMAKQYFVGVRSRTFALGQIPHPQFPAVTAAASDNGQVSQLYP